MLRRASVLLAVPIALLAAATPAAAKGPVVELAGAEPLAGQRVLLAGSKLGLRATAPGAQPGSTVVITWTVNGRRARRTTQPLAGGGEAFDSLRVELPGTVTVSANRVLTSKMPLTGTA